MSGHVSMTREQRRYHRGVDPPDFDSVPSGIWSPARPDHDGERRHPPRASAVGGFSFATLPHTHSLSLVPILCRSGRHGLELLVKSSDLWPNWIYLAAGVTVGRATFTLKTQNQVEFRASKVHSE